MPHILHALGSQADLVAGTGIVADGGRHVGVLDAVSIRQAADLIKPVEFHSIAVFGSKLFRNPAKLFWVKFFCAKCFAQVPASSSALSQTTKPSAHAPIALLSVEAARAARCSVQGCLSGRLRRKYGRWKGRRNNL
ncbi:hypothetical protein ACFQY9_22880 [Microvirga aerilata]|uniref:hypothetical protein n=1 Tax=Microvirga aerilata TaxID=670292 RepID=UPI0036316D37